jgi:hypothetical protein
MMPIAQQQAQANLDAVRAQSQLNNPDVYTQQGGPDDVQTHKVTVDPADPNHMIVTDAMSPTQTGLYNQQVDSQQGLFNLINNQGIPNAVTALQKTFTPTHGALTDFAPGYMPQTGFQYDQGTGQAPNLQGGLDFSGVPEMPTADSSVRDQVANSIFGQGAQMLDQQFAGQQKALDTQLSNQGIFAGTQGPGPTAYDVSQRNLGQQRTQAYGDLVDRAIQGGGDAMQQLYNMQLQGRQQGVGEVAQQGAFTNNARQQELTAALNAMQAKNTAVGDQYNVAASQAALNNTGQAQDFSQAITGATTPINIMTALLGAGQVQQPSYQGYEGGNVVAPAPLMQAAQANTTNATNTFNAGQAAIGNWTQMAGAIGGGAKFSDRRLKSNIKYLARTDTGLNVYEYEIFGRHEVGVMADEVEKVFPEAVTTGPDGYKRVNYHMLGL